MKKAIIFNLLFIVAVFILLLAIPNCLPELSQIEKTMTSLNDGSFYLVENRSDSSFIYQVDKKGFIKSAYFQKSVYGDERSAITKVATDNTNIYYICETGDVFGGTYNNFKILKLENGVGNPKVIYQGTPGDEVPNSITAEGGILFLTFGIKNGLSATVYSLNPTEEDAKLSYVLDMDAPQGRSIVECSYSASTLYCLMENGDLMCSQSGENELVYIADSISEFSVCNGRLWANKFKSGAVFTNAKGVFQKAATTPTDYVVRAGMDLNDGNMAMLAVNSQNKAMLLLKKGTIFEEHSTLKVSLGVRFQSKKSQLMRLFLFCVIISLLFLIAYFIYKRSRKLAVRVAVVGTYGIIVVMLLTTTAVLTSGWFAADDMDSEVTLIGQNYISQMQTTDLAKLSDVNFYGSDSYVKLKKLLEPTNIVLNKRTFLVQGVLLTKDETNHTVLAISNNRLTNGMTQVCYNEKLAKAVLEVFESQTSSMIKYTEQGRSVSADIRSVSLIGKPAAVLVTKLTIGKSFATPTVIIVMLLVGGVLCLLFFSLILLSIFSITRPLRQLAGQMSAIAQGSLSMNKIWSGQDEVGSMSHSIQEMCVALSIKDYEMNNTVKSFYRFVPRGLDKLLKRASVMEVSLGDMETINGGVSILCINNREEVRGDLDDAQFMQFVNECYGVIDRNISKNKGFSLSSDFNLARIDSVYIDSPQNAISFSLGLLAEATKSNSSLPTPEFFMLLHTSSFLYSIAGTKERAFPFISSSELDFLATLSEKFRGMNVNVVATEAYINSLQTPPCSRYIGFVVSPDEQYIYKLYELLDNCTDIERAGRMSCSAKFQEALQLFYKNDFYLARNAFSSVLKVDNRDSIARWYLFACEHFFNSETIEDATYNLFSIE